METRDRTYFILLALVIAFGAYLRLYGLGVPSFWVDELDFVVAAQSQSRVGEPLLASGYAYPRTPLLTHSLVLIYKVLGVSEFSTRVPSAIFGILTIPLIFFIGRKWFDARTGLFAAILLTCAPFEIGWSRACRMYAILQLLFMAGLFFFYLGFEASKPGLDAVSGKRRFSRLIQKWDLNIPYLLLGGFFLFLSYTSHQNAALFLLSLLVYLFVMAARSLVQARKQEIELRSVLQNKYVALSALALMLILIAALIPPLREFIAYAVGYQPRWAGVSSAQNEWRIFEFIFSMEHFPVFLLFLMGAALIVRRWHKAGIYSLISFIVPVLMFSFVFQYRKNDYIYHVYPILFLLAGFTLSELAGLLASKRTFLNENKLGLLRNHGLREVALIGICLVWLPLTPGFRLAQKIPRLPDGHFNGAIYHNEWKEAAAFIKPKVSDEDLLLSTLPLSVQYYVGRADYNLNWSNSHLSRTHNYVAPDGRLIDLYSGTDIIESAQKLQQIMAEHSGWLLVDTYRFGNDIYVPAQVRTLVKSSMTLTFETSRKTVAIYRWNKTQNKES